MDWRLASGPRSSAPEHACSYSIAEATRGCPRVSSGLVSLFKNTDANFMLNMMYFFFSIPTLGRYEHTVVKDLRFLVDHVHRERVPPPAPPPPQAAANAPLSWLDWPLEVLADGGCHATPRGDSALELAVVSDAPPGTHPDALVTEWAASSQPGVGGPWF